MPDLSHACAGAESALGRSSRPFVAGKARIRYGFGLAPPRCARSSSAPVEGADDQQDAAICHDYGSPSRWVSSTRMRITPCARAMHEGRERLAAVRVPSKLNAPSICCPTG